MAALWRARPQLDFRFRHDPEDSDWEGEGGGWGHAWGSVEEGSLHSWDEEEVCPSAPRSDSAESSWDRSSDHGSEPGSDAGGSDDGGSDG